MDNLVSDLKYIEDILLEITYISDIKLRCYPENGFSGATCNMCALLDRIKYVHQNALTKIQELIKQQEGNEHASL